ncbi:MAG TPA: aminoglycoside phosphotransferase family protein [Streptosporangiaceae bacterium]|nr:aminoglycoside phosphotransferase family protein [Streptosporangiaceae bacterium]
MLGDAVISDWCASAFGERMARVMFRTGHLAQVVGTELADGRQVVIKVRPFERRVAGCVAVQAHLAKSGFPCPAPLAGPEEIRGFAVTGEALTPEGSQRSPGRGAEAFAELLARLVALAPDPASVPALTPSPPWNAWDHPGSRLWPDRDDYGRDINALPCPGWVDRAVAQVRQHLRACADPPRIGHGDWESQNIRWSGDTPLAVHDWDSVIAQPEVAIAGLASAVWPAAGGPGEAATVEQSADFLAKYQACAGRRWSARKIRDAWAAGLWVRLFNAKKDAASGGGPQLDRLADEIGERMARAGLPER